MNALEKQTHKIDRTASTGTLWAVKAWHLNRKADTGAERERSAAIVAAINAEMTVRLGKNNILAA